jgi:hypothetical protein
MRIGKEERDRLKNNASLAALVCVVLIHTLVHFASFSFTDDAGKPEFTSLESLLCQR